jgi:uncharacterized membrane protein YidH (DUF202 family)|tara:strand:+ start:188 stop:421 length:234 start_codon:yes stop_codon:yes gene_type:complete
MSIQNKIPASLIAFGVVQIVAFSFFMAGLDSNINQNEKDHIRLSERVRIMEISVHSQAVTIARMDENIKAILKSLTR